MYELLMENYTLNKQNYELQTVPNSYLVLYFR
jgi:hypothetical protein